MKKKRFVKLLMSMGVSRNEANAVTMIVRVGARWPELHQQINTKSKETK